MTDITLNNITSGYNVNKINDNFDAIEAAVNGQMLHLVGGNNVLQQDIDMNGHALLNLESNPEDPASFATQADITNAVDAHVAELDPHVQYAMEADLSSHVGNVTNPHSVTKAQVGLANADNTSDVNKPISSATQAALDLKATNPMTSVGDVIKGGTAGVPERVAIGATGQVLKVVGGVPTWADETAGGLSDAPINGNTYSRKDATWVSLSGLYQPADATLTSIAALGTGADKGVYFTGADVAAEYALTAFARTILDDTDAASMRGTLALGNVNNTSDVNKPVSTAQQAALDLKANLASPAFTGVPTASTATPGTNTAQVATTAFVQEAAPAKSLCTAWVNFNGSGVVAILDSYNVSSITDNGTGNYTINFAAAMNNSNYSPSGFARDTGTARAVSVFAPSTGTKSTSALQITVRQDDSTLIDSANIGVTIHGGK